MVINIISVCLNDSKGLIRTIESIDSQDYSSWIHHIQDGGSGDGTQESALTHGDVRRTLTVEHDFGVYDAMNRAAAQNLGDLIWFLNAGDTLADSSVLSRVAEHYSTHRWDWAHGGLIWQDEQNVTHLRPAASVMPRRVLFGLDVYPHPSCIFTAGLLRALEGYDLRLSIASDQDLCLRANSISQPAVIPFALASFAPGGLSSRLSIRELEQELHTLRGVRSHYVLGSRRVDALFSRSMGGARWLRRQIRLPKVGWFKALGPD